MPSKKNYDTHLYCGLTNAQVRALAALQGHAGPYRQGDRLPGYHAGTRSIEIRTLLCLADLGLLREGAHGEWWFTAKTQRALNGAVQAMSRGEGVPKGTAQYRARKALAALKAADDPSAAPDVVAEDFHGGEAPRAIPAETPVTPPETPAQTSPAPSPSSDDLDADEAFSRDWMAIVAVFNGTPGIIEADRRAVRAWADGVGQTGWDKVRASSMRAVERMAKVARRRLFMAQHKP